MIDDGAHSYRNPLPSSFISTEITFSVSPGTYTVGMHGFTVNAGVVENVYLSLLGMPTSNNRNYSSSIPSNQITYPFRNGPLNGQ
jgi:hypothetical protein